MLTNDQIRTIQQYMQLKTFCERAGVNYNTVKGALHFDRGSDYHTAAPEWRFALAKQLQRDIEALSAVLQGHHAPAQ